MENITREELREKVYRGDEFTLVEALSERHYETSHLPGAVNLPYEFVDEAEKVLPDKSSDIVVYCMNEDCESSRAEVRELTERGYENVRHYAGGKQDWVKAGLPIEGKRASDGTRSRED